MINYNLKYFMYIHFFKVLYIWVSAYLKLLLLLLLVVFVAIVQASLVLRIIVLAAKKNKNLSRYSRILQLAWQKIKSKYERYFEQKTTPDSRYGISAFCSFGTPPSFQATAKTTAVNLIDYQQSVGLTMKLARKTIKI